MKSTLRLILLTFVLLTVKNVFAQEKAQKWYFGYRTGLDFSKGRPFVIRGESGVTRQKGIQNEWRSIENECSVMMSDDEGNVIFFSDGSTVWDSKFKTVNLILESSSSHAQMHALKLPRSNSKYLIFNPSGLKDQVTGWDYSVLDASEPLNIKVVKANEKIVKGPFMQASTVVPHCNGTDFWLVLHYADDREGSYLSILIDSSGVKSQVTSKGYYKSPVPKSATPNDYYSIGNMDVNSRYNMLATTFYGNGKDAVCELVEFDNKTGEVKSKTAHINNFSNPDDIYGVAFSPNDSLLYITECEGEKLHQYGIYHEKESKINASRMTLHHGGSTMARLGQIQQGPHGALLIPLDFSGRVYDVGCNFIGVVKSPNKRGSKARWSWDEICVPYDYKMHLGLGLPSLPKYHIECPQELIVQTVVEELIEQPVEEPKLKMEVGDTVILPQLVFPSNSFELTDSVKIILADVVQLMQQKAGMKMKIHGHTDDVGDFRANITLSENRALSVKNFLIEQGINATRLSSKGYGESRPKVPNVDKESQALNRRVEFISE